jgi:glycolate oxidase FAD binding subunit
MAEISLARSLSSSSIGLSLYGGDEDRKQFAIDGREPREVVFPESIEQVSAILQAAREQCLAVAPVGHGGFLHLGGLPRRYDLALSLQRLNRVVDYQPTDMTVTVEAGMTLARLQEVLGEHGQWLPVDPPLLEQATIGGIIAANLSGPVRLSQGTMRDFLIGLKVVQADGTIIKGGGRVVKNVAGYDLPKLYCGSFGTLGVIAEATFKVRPRPETQIVLSLAFPSVESVMAIALQVLSSELQPFFLELANFDPLSGRERKTSTYRLFISFAGIAEEVSYQRTCLRESNGPDESFVEELQGSNIQALMQELRDFPVAGEAALRCKVSVLPSQVTPFWRAVEEESGLRGMSVQLLSRAGNGIVYVRVPSVEGANAEKLLSLVDWLRILVKKLDGYVVIEAVDPALKDRVDVWGHVGGAFPLMKRLKETLDPHGVLNPGRFVGGI